MGVLVNPLWHPYITALWVATVIGYVWILNLDHAPFLLHVFSVINIFQFVMMMMAAFVDSPALNYLSFWATQLMAMGIVLAIAMGYAWRCARSRYRLPRSFQILAAVVMVTLVGTVVLLRLWQREPDTSLLLSLDQYANLWLCGFLWLTYLCNSMLGEHDMLHDVVQGFVILYSVNLVTSSLRVYIPVTRETLWVADMLCQVGVVAWWIHTVKRERFA